ncbi:COG3014 family protein [Mesonia aestuariivivens]|uniref:RagB/SusD family nutrient uptake outer membrane protein n=1 Tax=Mesonia aestuariivivens TaxID=2796128 RepID=A0ABS6W3P6_9FLAO|nr:hypothetical protein [Mesonia aestuariivivens]MBW2962478.1 hypothetical protein [Mesonia aestuariivivens]
MPIPTKFWLKSISVGVFVCLLNSCGITYNDRSLEFQNEVYHRNFTKAVTLIEDNKFLSKKRNHLLYLMEKGKVEHMNGKFKESNQLFEQAYVLIDDNIKTNAGQAIAAKLTNPMAAPYKGEDFEKVMIHYYMALNYFQLGMPNEALVEAKRINIKLQQLNQKYKKNKNKYTEDAFAQILQGLLYEATGDVNNAFIAYRNAEELYAANNNSYYGVSLPLQLQKDLVRTSKQLGFTQEYKSYTKQFNLTDADIQPHPAEAIIFWENGLGPAKDQTQITAVDGAFIAVDDPDFPIFIPIPPGTNLGITSIAIPKYVQRESFYKGAHITFNNQQKSFELVEDFYPIARQTLHDRMLREAVDIALRVGAKKATSAGLGAIAKQLLGDDAEELIKASADIAGAATEKADTRNWQTLPATISYVRVPLKEQTKNTFIIEKYGNATDRDTISIPYKKGLQLQSYYDVGRATSNYVKPQFKIQQDELEKKASSSKDSISTLNDK